MFNIYYIPCGFQAFFCFYENIFREAGGHAEKMAEESE